MAATSYQSRDADIDVGRLFAALWRDRWIILIGALAATGIVTFLLMLATPQYRSDARVLIDAGESVFTRPERDPLADQTRLDQEAVASQVEIITSTDLLLRVAGELDLASRGEFNADANLTTFRRGLIMLGLAADPSAASEEKQVLDAMRGRLTVFPVNNSRVIVIEFRSSDRELAARVPNALAAAYVALESQAQLLNTGAAARYLEGEIGRLQGEVRTAEAAAAVFRADNGLLLGQNNAVLATQQLAELSTELSRVRAERSSVEARVRSVETALRDGAAVETVPDVIASPVIARLTEQQANLRAQLADLSTTLLSGHPRMQALQSQIDGLDAQIRSQARNVLAGLRNEAEIARGRETELNADLNTLKAASARANDSEVELRALEREATSKRALLETFLVRFREAQSRDQGEYAPAKARLISSATVPIAPSFPRTAPLMSATFVASLVFMIIVTLMRELFSRRALVPAPTSGLRPAAEAVASAAPVADRSPSAPTVSGETAPRADAGRQWRLWPPTQEARPADSGEVAADGGPANDNHSVAAVAAKLIQRGAGRALFVAPPGGTGAHSAVEIARLLDRKGLRVIVLDLSGAGQAGGLMGADTADPGITDLLAAEASYSEVIFGDIGSGAHIVPLGQAGSDRALSGIERLPIILEGLGAAYDIVLVDCGVADAAGLDRLVSSDCEIVLSVDTLTDENTVGAASDLAAGGFRDVLIVIDGPEVAPDPDASARLRKAG